MSIVEVIIFLVAFLIGFAVAWYIKNNELALEKQAIKTQTAALQDIELRFKAVAGDVLRTHTADFQSQVNQKERTFEKMVEGVSKSMESVERKITDFDKSRVEQFGALGTSIKQMLDTGTKMQEEAQSLKTVLSSAGTTARGRWGETVLRNLLEESGLTEGIDFHIQGTIEGEGAAALRPDVIINLPGDLRMAIDSKASLDNYIKAVEENDPVKKLQHVIAFTQGLRTIITKLSNKEYQKHLDPKIPYVIMFIPGEAAIRAAFEQDPSLYRDAQAKKVLIASPATIMPMILLIAHAWKQHKSIENASKIMTEITVLGDRLKTFSSHLGDIGSSLLGAVKTFNSAVGSWDLRVHPQIDKIVTIGGNLNLDSNLHQIEEEPRLPQKTLPPASK